MIFSSTNTMSQRLLMKRKAVCLEHPMQIDSGGIATVRFSRGTIRAEMKYTSSALISLKYVFTRNYEIKLLDHYVKIAISVFIFLHLHLTLYLKLYNIR